MQLSVNTSSRLRYFAAGFFANALWGFMAFPLRSLVEWPSDTVLYFRIFSALFFSWLFIFLFRFSTLKMDWLRVRALPRVEKKRLGILLLLSSILIIGNWFSFIYAINRVSITSAAFAYLVCPLITTLAGYFILNEKLSKMKWMSLAIAFVAVLMLGQASLVEVLWSITIASFYAFYLIIQRVLKDIDKFHFLAVQMIVCVVLILPIMVFSKHDIPSNSSFWIGISILGIIFTLIPLFLSMYALNRLSSSTMGVLIYINPIISFAVAIAFFGEIITLHQAIAYFLLIIAIVLYNSDFVKQIFAKFARRESA